MLSIVYYGHNIKVLRNKKLKVKVNFIVGHEGPDNSTLSITSTLYEGLIFQRHALAIVHSGKGSGAHCIGGWMGSKTSLDGCGKYRPPEGFGPQRISIQSTFPQVPFLNMIHT